MNIKGKISVVVPIYNVENYLKKCIDSLINQTYKNLEIILVDDGSPDFCPKICDEYKKQDERIKVIHKQNGGLSSARNAGLEVATGDFITFVDSDDFLELDIYEKVIDIFNSNSVEIVSMTMQLVNEKYEVINQGLTETFSIGNCSSRNYFKGMVQRKLSASVCDKVFLKSTIENLRFDEMRLNEDFFFLASLLLEQNCTIFLMNDIGYNYFTRVNSISKSGFGKSLRDAVYNTRDLYQQYQADEEIKALLAALAVYQARTCVVVMSKSQFKEEKEFVSLCRTTMKEYRKYIKNSFMSEKDKIFCYVFLAVPNLAKKMIDLIR